MARGSAAELLVRFAEPPKGEVTLVVGGGVQERDEAAALAAVQELVGAGVPRRQAADVVARLLSLSRNTLYRESLQTD